MPDLPSQRGRRPEILLDQNCRIGHCQNSTSAKTENSEGLSVEVSFEIRDPPALSLCFACGLNITGSQRLAGLQGPNIVGTAGGLVLLVIPFSVDGGMNPQYWDNFVYRAGPGTPSLHLIPRPPDPTSFLTKLVAVLPVGDDGGEHYAVAFPQVELLPLEPRRHCTLNIYRSDRKAWRTRVELIAEDAKTQHVMASLLANDATSVVYAGSGLVGWDDLWLGIFLCNVHGWVDLWLGIFLCNVLDEKPTARFVPVPQPWKTYFQWNSEFEDVNPRPFREMTVHDGVIKFIELQDHRGPAFNVKRRDDQGWMATTWTRPISSDVWHEGLTFDTSDICLPAEHHRSDRSLLSWLCFPFGSGPSRSSPYKGRGKESKSVTDPSFLHLLPPEILDEEKKLTWEKVTSGSPTLSFQDDGIVYILVVGLCDPTAFVLTVNTRSLTLESCAQFSGEEMLGHEPSYVLSALSSYFGMAT